MKAKLSVYVELPNTGKVRSRVENADAEMSAKIREAITAAVVETLNGAGQRAFRNEMAEAFKGMGYTAKDAKAAAYIMSTNSEAWAINVSATPIKGEETTDEAEAPAETAQAPASDFED